MSISLHKVWALFRKDLKDALKNPQCIVLIALPILMVALYGSIRVEGEEVMGGTMAFIFGLLMNLSILPLTFMSMMIAEEKEKFTLRTLMLSNVSAWDFLISKALLVLLITQLSGGAIFFLSKPEGVLFPPLMGYMALATLCLVFFGAVIGIISRNQMTTGLYGAPAMLLFLLPPMLGQMDEAIAAYARFTPTSALMNLLFAGETVLFNISVLLGWAVLGVGLFIFAYQRKRLD